MPIAFVSNLPTLFPIKRLVSGEAYNIFAISYRVVLFPDPFLPIRAIIPFGIVFESGASLTALKSNST